MNTITAALNKSGKLHGAVSTRKRRAEYVLGALMNYTSVVIHAAFSGASPCRHSLAFLHGLDLNPVTLLCHALENFIFLCSSRERITQPDL